MTERSGPSLRGRARRRRTRAPRGPLLAPRQALLLSILLGVAALVPTLVVTSLAAWTASVPHPGNTFSTNTILLQDNQGAQGGSASSSGTAIFSVANIEPNSPATTGCIGVVFSGTAPASGLTLSAALGGAGQSTLQTQLTMTAAAYNTSGSVTATGNNTNSGSCTNYPAGGSNQTIGSQGSTLQAWASGGPYTISSPVTNTWYTFTVSGLPPTDNSCVTYCAQTITISLTWTLTAA